MKLKNLFLLLFVMIASVASAQQLPAIQDDPAVRKGKLENGLTYYIRHNEWPKDRCELFIAQRVGSLQENDEQQGLAHFLEHMCFNGTKHFPGDNILRYCESIGVKFGQDLNAYTAIDRTVYNISNVPATRQSAVDSCLLILADWADGLLLEGEEIDKERGVIHEEWRVRNSAQQRMLTRSLPKMYPAGKAGEKYAYRMPIGLMDIVLNFDHQVLRDYYEKWYRPDNQGIIVVGDIDVDYMENKIKEYFGGIEMPANPAKVVRDEVADNEEPIVIIDKDKEQQANLVEMMIKHDAFPAEIKGNTQYWLLQFAVNAATSMLNDRLAEAAQNPDCPYVQAFCYDGNYMLASTKKAFTLGGVPKTENDIYATATAVMQEALRAAQFGFTETEFARFKANMLSEYEKAYSNKDRRKNNQFCNEYVENFLENEPMASIDDEYQFMSMVIPNLPVQMVNEIIKMLIPETNKNLVLVNYNIEREGRQYPTETDLLEAINKARATKLEAYVDNVKNEPLMTTMPEKGKIVKEEDSKKFGYKTLTLSNGVTVILKKTDYKQDQVAMYGVGFGGSSLYGEKDFANLQILPIALASSGLGNFDNTELSKALAGKHASVSMTLGQTRQHINCSSTPKDVETMMQLLYLNFTNIKKDQKVYDNNMKAIALNLKNRDKNNDAIFGDSVKSTMYCGNPRFADLKLADLDKVSYDRALEIAKERLSNANGYTFYIIGNFDEATIRPLIEQYIAALPSQMNIVKGKNVSTLAKGHVINEFKREMEIPAANSILTWRNTKLPYTLENVIKTDIAGQILNMIYLKEIREERGATYTVQAWGNMSRNDYETTAELQAYCPMKPEMADVALKILRDEVPGLAKKCDADMLKKVQEFMIKNIGDQEKSNGYWLNTIISYRDYGVDFNTEYRNIVNAQTPESICKFMKKFLKGMDQIEVIMLPETK